LDETWKKYYENDANFMEDVTDGDGKKTGTRSMKCAEVAAKIPESLLKDNLPADNAALKEKVNLLVSAFKGFLERTPKQDFTTIKSNINQKVFF